MTVTPCMAKSSLENRAVADDGQRRCAGGAYSARELAARRPGAALQHGAEWEVLFGNVQPLADEREKLVQKSDRERAPLDDEFGVDGEGHLHVCRLPAGGG